MGFRPWRTRPAEPHSLRHSEIERRGSCMARLDVRVKLSLVVAACLLSLVVLLKNVVGVSPEVLSRDFIIYSSIYIAFALFVPVQEGKQKVMGLDSAFLSGLAILLTTVAIVAFYALAPKNRQIACRQKK